MPIEWAVPIKRGVTPRSAQTDLLKNALAGEQFGGKADYEAQHRQTAIPGLGEGHEAEAGSGVSHGPCGLFQGL